MPGKVYQETWQAAKVYLFARLQAETQPGGALVGLTAVETVAPPESKTTPVLGFQFRTSGERPGGINKLDAQFVFEFNLVLERDFDPLQTDAAKQAADVAENWWNDGAGNGLGAVLNSDPTLGGIAIDFTLDHQIVIGRGVLAENETSALVVARMVFRAERPVY